MSEQAKLFTGTQAEHEENLEKEPLINKSGWKRILAAGVVAFCLSCVGGYMTVQWAVGLLFT